MLLNCGVGEDLRVPWIARRSNQSILKEISPEYSLEGLMLKQKLPILWPLDAKNWLIRKDLDAGKDWRQEEEDRGWDGWMASLPRQAWVWPSSRNWWWTGNLACCSPLGCKELDMTERLNWTEGTFRNLLQHHNLKESILQHSAFFMV